MGERDVVVLAGRSVCSLLGDAKSGAGIQGQDGGQTVVADGRVYMTFGDTVLSTGGYLPNGIAWSDDTDASDCIDLQPKEVNGVAVPLLDRIPGELTVWPSGMELVGKQDVYLYYASVVPDPVGGWRVAGVGLASFNLADLAAERLLDGLLVWKSPGPLPNRIFSDDVYLYVLLNSKRDVWITDTIASRVQKDSFDSPETYEYWEPATGEWIGGLWDAATDSWDDAINDVTPILSQFGMHNGLDVAYNEFLDAWLGVYATNLMTSIKVRVAKNPLGPWSDEQTQLVDCGFYHGPTSAPFLCYTGVQHETFSRDGGRTIYITYSNGDDYQVRLHEIRLAAPVNEWIGVNGEAVYVPATAAGPADATLAGLGFYASDIPVPGFTAIHRYNNDATGQNRYGATPPAGGDYQDVGVSFYAPADADAATATNERYSPVFRWTLDGEERYSPMNLLDAGYERHEVAFYSPCPGGDSEAEASCLESVHGDEAFYIDSDGDGCSDIQELGLHARAGGRRSPDNFWDFYDTPGLSGQRDGAITLSEDILGLIWRLGATDDNGEAILNRYSNSLTPLPDDPTAYHPAFDRSPPDPGASRLDLGPPDGVIDLSNDFLSMIYQYGHVCAN